MKRLLIFLPIILLSISSCFKDLGNYDYKKINEITFDGIENFYRVEYPDGILKITPMIKSSLNNDYSDYIYEWKAVESAPKTKSYIIGIERYISSEISLLPGQYTLYFKVTDKKNGLIWKTYTTLYVSTGTSRGFLLAGNNNKGEFQLDMIKMPTSGDTTIAINLLRNSNIPQVKNARNIMFTGGMANMNNSRFWIMGKEQSYYIDRTTFQGELSNIFRPLSYSLHNIPNQLTVADVAPRVNKIGGTPSTTSYRAVSTNEGYIFYNSSLTLNGDVYGNPVNRVDINTESYFNASPYIIYSMGFWRGMVIYDNDNNRFTFCSATGSSCTLLTDRITDLFPWNQGSNGRRLVYAENTRNTLNGVSNGNSYVIMKDIQGDYHIYMINAAYLSSAPSKTGYYLINKAIAPNIDDAADKKLFAFSSTRTVMFYASGSNLYYYDYNKGNERSGLLKSFNGEEITMIQFDIQTGNNGYRDLYIATRNSSGTGTLQKLIIGTDANNIDYTIENNTVWTGLASIVKMEWRNQE